MFRTFVDNLAARWLRGRGFMTLPYPFVGLVIGAGTGTWRRCGNGVEYVVWLPASHRQIVICNSVILERKHASH